MKIIAPIIAVAGLLLTGLLYASPSDTGLEHGKRLGVEKQLTIPDQIPGKSCGPIHSVPDGGSSLALLALGCASLAFWRVKLA